MNSPHLSEARIGTEQLESYLQEWVFEAQSRRFSDAYIQNMNHSINPWIWWLRKEGHTDAGRLEIRAFLAYIGGDAPEGGRWGNPRETERLKPGTVRTYWQRLSTFCRWLVEQDHIADNPMEKVKAPVARPDEIEPLSEQQVMAMLAAAKKTRHPRRDTAILLVLLDTAMRNSELVGLKKRNLDLENRQITVLGKGNKRRTLFFSPDTAQALVRYLRGEERGPDDPLFVSERGYAFSREGLTQLCERIAIVAGVPIRATPHTWRHTAALWTLKGDMNPFALQKMLGHTDLTMTRRYVAIADADVKAQHEKASPVGQLVSHQGRSRPEPRHHDRIRGARQPDKPPDGARLVRMVRSRRVGPLAVPRGCSRSTSTPAPSPTSTRAPSVAPAREARPMPPGPPARMNQGAPDRAVAPMPEPARTLAPQGAFWKSLPPAPLMDEGQIAMAFLMMEYEARKAGSAGSARTS